MAAKMKLPSFGLLLIQCILLANTEFISYDRPITYVQDVSSCNQTATTASYLDMTTLECKPCPLNSAGSANGLNCECKQGFRYIKNLGGGAIECEACPTDQVASSSGYECIVCPAGTAYSGVTKTCSDCPSTTGNNDVIGPELGLTGIPYTSSGSLTKQCQKCEANSWASADKTRCERCIYHFYTNGSLSPECVCPTGTGTDSVAAGGYCFTNVATNTIDMSLELNFVIPRTTSEDSLLLKENLRAAFVMCVMSNVTACQILSNLCVLTLYEYRANGAATTPCNMYFTFFQAASIFVPDNIPWLYYYQGGQPIPGDDVVRNDYLKTQYTFSPESRLQYRVVKYSFNGEYLGISGVENGLLQLCSDSTRRLNAAYVFGTQYSQSCSIAALNLWDKLKYPSVFYDIYLEITEDGEQKLFPIPVNILNYQSADQGFDEVNRDYQMVNVAGLRRELRRSEADWVLFRRFFMVDNVAAVGVADEPAPMIRYAKSITIQVTLQDNTNLGIIYPPYLKIDYGTATYEDAQAGASVDVSFNVEYSFTNSQHTRDFQISVGTLSTLGVIYAGYRTWVWSKRSGRMQIDFPTIVNFFFFVAGTLGNVFFVMSFGLAFYWLIFFKRQSVVFLVHPSGQAVEDWLGMFASAFALKALQIIHLIFMQSTIDIFFIDWERSRGTLGTSAEGTKSREVPVSIWRTYFCANEWNELQTTRKINQIFQIFSVLFFLVVVGFENVATIDPDGNVSKDSLAYQAEMSNIFRYGIAALIYVLVGIVQWIFFTFIYERFIEDKVRQFVDLCSMSNISVFIMANAQFGYYIHGRSVHGKADTNMREMFEMMKKEEEDMCGQRGLLPNTEQQTFIMSLPRKLRLKYEQVLLPAQLEGAAAGTRLDRGGGGRIAGTAIEKQVEAYSTINRFFSAFIDHSLRDLDYVVKDKTFLENIMDTEFYDATDSGIMYNDGGHSFDDVLFYGNEMTLMLFDALLFCMVDHIFTNFVVAGVITYIISEVIVQIRAMAARKNLANKTLVDKRFLI